MKFKLKWLQTITIAILVTWCLVLLFKKKNNNHSPVEIRDTPIIAVVVCGDRTNEALNMIKSALLFSRTQNDLLKFIIVCEKQLKEGIDEKLSEWKDNHKLAFDYEIMNLQFPEAKKKEWKKLFKPCAAQRLFLPTVLGDTDAVLYLDSDTLFLSPPIEIWKFFKQFNKTQFLGVAAEHEDKNAGWYNRFARHPYYKPLGVNSGVCLFNLTRMRNYNWTNHIEPIYEKYKLKIVWGEQDIINVFGALHPNSFYILNCVYNYRADHCMYMNVCPSSADGIKVLHGNRGYFHNQLAQPIFSYIYNAFDEYQFNMDPQIIIKTIEANLAIPGRNTNCDKLSESFLFNLKTYFNSSYDNFNNKFFR